MGFVVAIGIASAVAPPNELGLSTCCGGGFNHIYGGFLDLRMLCFCNGKCQSFMYEILTAMIGNKANHGIHRFLQAPPSLKFTIEGQGRVLTYLTRLLRSSNASSVVQTQIHRGRGDSVCVDILTTESNILLS